MAGEFINNQDIGVPVDDNTSFEIANDDTVNSNVKNFLSGFNMKLPEEQRITPQNIPQQLSIGNIEVRPRVVIQGSRRTDTPEVRLPDGSVFLNNQVDQVQGNVGADFRTKSGVEFGGDVSGYYTAGKLKFPKELQNLGAPEIEKYGSKGINELKAYLGMPIGDANVGVTQKFSGDMTPRELSAYLNIPLSKNVNLDFNAALDSPAYDAPEVGGEYLGNENRVGGKLTYKFN